MQSTDSDLDMLCHKKMGLAVYKFSAGGYAMQFFAIDKK